MKNRSIVALAGALWFLSACNGRATNVAEKPSPPQSEPVVAPDATSAVTRTADAIIAGQVAERNADAAGLRAAAGKLDNLGARPDDDQHDDLSESWSRQASVIDPSTPPAVYRGRALGPSYKKGVVSATSRVSINQIFLAGKKASVALVPASSKPVSIEISDGEGRKICSRLTSLKPANCEWLPLFTERYQIDIRTSESRPVSYYLVSN